MSLKIEDNIPFPVKTGLAENCYSAITKALIQLKPTQSIFFAGKDHPQLRTYTKRITARLGWEFRMHREPGGIRVWRVS